ncbi:hypothetical protein [Streptomyces sp. NPDC089799]|uniref:hypothetical protein n=1 Tax=Streptomyces sp. NPDC089799 TaxID=3155066 RepID=UPI0034150545
MDVEKDFEAVAHELYGLRPAEFTAARNTRAARARTAGDKELAARIAGLRKPSTAAWAAGLLARQRPAETEALLALGGALRDAHRTLDGVRLRQLSHDRHRVIAALARTAGELAAAAGQAVGGTVLQEVEQILHAVLADESVAAEWAAGRLAKRPVAAVGFEGLEPEPGAVPSPPEPASASAPRTPAADRQDREKQEWEREQQKKRRTEQRKAQLRRLREAQQEQARTRAEAERLESELAARADRLRSTRDAVAEAERELRAATGRLDAARAAHTEAATRHDEASRAAARARTRAEAADAGEAEAGKAAEPGGPEEPGGVED